jgi:hypothetical protein
VKGRERKRRSKSEREKEELRKVEEMIEYIIWK